MSDQPHSNSAMERWTSGRGLLLAFVVVLAVLVVLAFVGSFDDAGSGAGSGNAIIPADDTTILPAD